VKARVVVTRDEPAGGPLATALARAGLEPIRCPVVREAEPLDAAPLARAAADLDRYDWLVVASRRAVESLIRARGGRVLPAALRTAAVGAGTAEALAAHGATATLTAPDAGSRALIERLARESFSGRRVLLPRADGGSGDVAAALRGAGAIADEVVAYRTIELEPEAVRAAWPSPEPDAAVIASPSAARALILAIGVERLNRLDLLVAIGPTTAAEIARAGLIATMPKSATFEAIAELLAEWLEPDAAASQPLAGASTRPLERAHPVERASEPSPIANRARQSTPAEGGRS
jgi:uroporphyrinogen-III synthase